MKNRMRDILGWVESAAMDMAESYDNADDAYEQWQDWAGDYIFDELRSMLKAGTKAEALQEDVAWLARALPGDKAANLEYLNETMKLASS